MMGLEDDCLLSFPCEMVPFYGNMMKSCEFSHGVFLGVSNFSSLVMFHGANRWKGVSSWQSPRKFANPLDASIPKQLRNSWAISNWFLVVQLVSCWFLHYILLSEQSNKGERALNLLLLAVNKPPIAPLPGKRWFGCNFFNETFNVVHLALQISAGWQDHHVTLIELFCGVDEHTIPTTLLI